MVLENGGKREERVWPASRWVRSVHFTHSKTLAVFCTESSGK